MYGYDGTYTAYNQAMAAYGASANQVAATAAYGTVNPAAAAQQAAAAQTTGLYSMFGEYSPYGYGTTAAAMGYSTTGYPYAQGYGTTTAAVAQPAPPTGPPSMAAYRNASSVTIGPSVAAAAASKAMTAVQKTTKPATTMGGGGGPQGYSYENAVYTAATSFLQSKAAGQTNQWLNKKTPGKSFPQKTRFNGTGGGNAAAAQQYYCEVCKISCAGSQTYKEHIDGQKHKKKEALAKGEGKVALPRNKISFRCDVCNVTCTGQDTYNSHVKGSKHQKAVAICKKMGKAVPITDQPTIIPPAQLGGAAKAMPPSSQTAQAVGGKKVVGVSTISFVPSGALATTAPSEDKKKACLEAVGSAGPAESTLDKEMQALLAAEQSVKPVGEEYIEAQKDQTGKLIQFLCKLCDCKFSDPNAKDIHLKGRRHRLQYKVKVNPNLEVDVKQFSKNRVKGTPVMPRQLHHPNFAYQSQFGAFPGAFGGERRFENMNDRYVQIKHNGIYPEDGKLQMIETLVLNIEKGLKNVSDFFADREAAKSEASGENKQKLLNESRMLQGVMRVGTLAKQLILKDDNEVEVVVLCTNYPTETLVREVAEILPGKCDPLTFAGNAKTYKAEVQLKQGAILMTAGDMLIKCRITFTSRVARDDGGASSGKPSNGLPLEKCLQALAELRRAKWFQARCPMLQSCQVTLRILRDIRQRIPSWTPLEDWTSELLVERILASSGAQLSVGDALRRVFEAISAGILFTSGPGLSDPCEKEKVDALSHLSNQQREDITSSAQHALRLIAFNQLYKILGIEKIPFFGAGTQGGAAPDRKRPAASTTPTQPEKMVKTESENKAPTQ